MKINYSTDGTSVPFASLIEGETFVIDGQLYMKTVELDNLVNAVRLSDGHLSHVGFSIPVIIKEAEVIFVK